MDIYAARADTHVCPLTPRKDRANIINQDTPCCNQFPMADYFPPVVRYVYVNSMEAEI